MNYMEAASIFVFGLCIGSYLNVAALRGLEGRNIFTGRSECPSCKTQIKWYDLMPIVSYIILWGRCRNCKTKISPIYMLGEAGTALAFLAMYIRFGISPKFAIGIVMASFIVICSVTDIKSRLILDKFTFPAMIILLTMELAFHPKEIYKGLIGAVGILALLMLVNFIKKDGMGGGDIKMFMFVGVVLGLPLTLFALFVASVLGLFAWIPLRIMNKTDNTLPFGPFIGVASLATYIAQDTTMLATIFPSIG